VRRNDTTTLRISGSKTTKKREDAFSYEAFNRELRGNASGRIYSLLQIAERNIKRVSCVLYKSHCFKGKGEGRGKDCSSNRREVIPRAKVMESRNESLSAAIIQAGIIHLRVFSGVRAGDTVSIPACHPRAIIPQRKCVNCISRNSLLSHVMEPPCRGSRSDCALLFGYKTRGTATKDHRERGQRVEPAGGGETAS